MQDVIAFSITMCLYCRLLWMGLLQCDPDQFLSPVYAMKVYPAPICKTLKPTSIIYNDVNGAERFCAFYFARIVGMIKSYYD